jgi:hypothetical protein
LRANAKSCDECGAPVEARTKMAERLRNSRAEVSV